jgi:hypothetical protein
VTDAESLGDRTARRASTKLRKQRSIGVEAFEAKEDPKVAFQVAEQRSTSLRRLHISTYLNSRIPIDRVAS